MVDTHKADTRGGDVAKADTRRSYGGYMACKVWGQGEHMAETRRAHGRQMAGKVWRRGQSGFKGRKADTRWKHGAQGGHKADKRRTKCGDAAKAESRRTMADKHRGRGQSISWPAFFLLRENPTVNCLGKK